MAAFLRRRLGVVVILAALVVLFSANRIAVFLTDYWWFGEVGFRDVFITLLSTRVLLGVIFGLVLAALIAGNLLLARKLRPFMIPSSPQQAQIQRYRDLADPYLPWIIAVIAVIFGFTSGVAISAQWETVLLWWNSNPVGTADPQFGVDIGFYLFDLPFWQLLQSWLFTSLVLTGLLTAGAHYLLGGIRPEAEGDKILPSVKAHLSIVLSAILAVWAWGYWLGRYELNFSQRGAVTGASYTDVNAELPALYLLIGVSVISIGLVLYSMRRQGFLLPGAAIGLLVVASIILQGAYPAAIQRLQVDPQELAQEERFLERNLEATRVAYGLDDIELRPFTITDDLSQDEVIDNEVTLRNIRLWDPQVLQTTYSELQALRPYYQFDSVAIDRYEIDGELRQVMLSTRELSQLPEGADSWQNRHTFYTHGFGVVASQVNTATPDGQPVFISRNIPPTGDEEVVPEVEPGLYYGESPNPVYTLVRTEAPELDFEDQETQEQALTEYDGAGGVPINGIGRRLAFALRFNDYNILLTNFLTSESRILYNRQIQERVGEVAPFLTLDASPYPAVINGRVVWIQDAYTTSNNYPYSERRTLQTGGQQTTQINYVRNSVKAVVDAYDGEITFYRVEEDDAVLDAWEGVFPDMFTPVSEADDDLVAHFRYPQDLFRLQSDLYQAYHIPSASAFYNRADEWDLPVDPAAAANQGVAAGDIGGTAAQRLEPYYLLMRLPGETDEEFVLIQPYLARDRPNMVAWLAGRSDGEHLNELFAVRFPSDSEVLGPQQAQARIEQDDDIAAYLTLREREGSRVIFGNLQVLPIGNSILYVEPLFLENPQAQIPELARVALVMGGRTAFDSTFTGALAQLLNIEVPDELLEDEARESVDDPIAGDDPDAPEPDAPDTDEPDDPDTDAPTPTDPPTAEAEELLIDALEAFARAEQALADGQLGRYQSAVTQARDLLEQLAELEGVSVSDLFDDGNDEGTSDQELLEGLEEQDAEDDA